MKALVASDLHFEFHRDGGRTLLGELAPADVFVCAGDLTSAPNLADALDLCCGRYRHVVFVAGNHEFYHSSLPAVRRVLAGAQWRHEGRLHVLDNSTCEIGGVRFVGTTMWTRHRPWVGKHQHMLNDFNLIEDADPLVYQENRQALAFLEETVASDDVVVTHHLPTPQSVAWRFRASPLNCFFLCDVEYLIKDRQPRLWIHGHTHDSFEYEVGRTRVLCNPFGYVGHEMNREFKTDLVLEL